MTALPRRIYLLLLLGGIVGLVGGGCGGSTGPVVGRDIERRVYLLRGQNVDQPPEIKGGYARLEQIQSYPQAAEEDEAYGVIWIQCTISASGAATRVQLAEGGHPALETEALRIIQQLEFSPATKGNAPIPAQIQLPIIFQGPYAKNKAQQES